MRSFRRTLSFLAPYRARVILAVILTMLVTLLQIVPPRLYQLAIDIAIAPAIKKTASIATKQAAPQLILMIAGGLIGVIVVRNVMSYLNSYTVTWIGHRFVFDLRFKTWQHLQRLSMAYHNQTQTGKIMARVTADIELIQGLIQTYIVFDGTLSSWWTKIVIGVLLGIVFAVIAAFVPLNVLAELINIGTLAAFSLIAVAVLVLRRTRPDLHRGFRCPGVPVVPLLAIGMCLFLMSHLQAVTWIAFAVWVVIGLLVYFGYARRRSLLHTPQQGVVPASETAR